VAFRYRNGTAHRPAQDPYYKKSNAWIAWLSWVIFAAEGRQDRDQKELLFGKTHKELLEIVSALGKEVEKLEGWQNPPMTRQEAFTVNSITKRDGWDTLFEWLALASMVAPSSGESCARSVQTDGVRIWSKWLESGQSGCVATPIIIEREKARWVEDLLFDTDHATLQHLQSQPFSLLVFLFVYCQG